MMNETPYNWRLLTPRTRSRLDFLVDKNMQIGVPCRLPGCEVTIPREVGRGRSRWFHDDPCAAEFRRRRSGLAAAADELAQHWESHTLTWRQRQEDLWEARWLLTVASTYARPQEWGAMPDADELSDAAMRLVGSIADSTAVKIRSSQDLLRLPNDKRARAAREAVNDQSKQLATLVTQLATLSPQMHLLDWFSEALAWAENKSSPEPPPAKRGG